MKRFWPSKKNKMLLEKLFYNHQRENSTLSEEIVLSKIDETDESYQGILLQKGEETPVPHLFSGHLEADLNIPSNGLLQIQLPEGSCCIQRYRYFYIPTASYPCLQKIWHGRAVDKGWQSKYH